MFACERGSRAREPLDLYLVTLSTGDEGQRALAVFYDFSTREFPHGNGFSISSGINTLSCQVIGLKLDYSGPTPKKIKTTSAGRSAHRKYKPH
jgi:hypothetical protein